MTNDESPSPRTQPSAPAAIVQAGHHLSSLGLSRGTAGNVSMREGDLITISPTGAVLGNLAPQELAVLTMDGAHVAGPRPSKEYPLHLALYRRDPEARAVVHLHSRHAAAVSCLPPWSASSALPPITPYFVMRVGQTPLIPYAPPGDPVQAEGIENLGFAFRAVLLQNHGPVTAGTSMAAAIDAATELEEACAIILALGDQDPVPLSAQATADLSRRYGSPWSS
ncbi:class II aldolase/adducin family protein [Phytoactinopolyspora mesophila]|uniref:Aldolase n=1 Tax=Phytoactinopolyspora mesophila TaxID=2650750 RepID=A0A7K3MBW8_9ACTN|nr:class II aldolase/adducin family protein [Phytoactinopolyspora mesophila]NDL60815.1 aldolase [Phytoactinopolyspora mesophila]